MKVEDIKRLPTEFNFKSNINTLVPLYHAVRGKHGYYVTCEDGSIGGWSIPKNEFHRHLMKNEYEVVT